RRTRHRHRNADDGHLQDGLHPVRLRLRRGLVLPLSDCPGDAGHVLRAPRAEGGLSEVVGGSRLAFTLKHLMLAVILMTVMFPVYWLVSMSVNSTRDLSARPLTLTVQ